MMAGTLTPQVFESAKESLRVAVVETLGLEKTHRLSRHLILTPPVGDCIKVLARSAAFTATQRLIPCVGCRCVWTARVAWVT